MESMTTQIDLPYTADDDSAVQTYQPVLPVYCPDGFAQPIDNTPCPVCGAQYPEEECKGLDSLLHK